MLIFIDESGDAGFKTLKGSSKYFVIALVIFQEEIDAEDAALTIKKLRKYLRKTDEFEFKFNKCNRQLRLSFLQSMQKSQFRIRAIILDKDVVYSNHLRTNTESFYNFSLRQVLEHNSNTIVNAKIRIDGHGERLFKQQLTKYLRKYLNTGTHKVIQNLRFRDSKNDVLIQMADMIAGSIRRYYEKNTTDWDIYRDTFKSKEEDIWVFK